MALSALESTTILRAIQASRMLIEQFKPLADALNVIYNSSGGVSDTITTEDLEAAEELSGLTQQQLDDALFVITSGVLTAVTQGYTALVTLSARG